MLFGIEIEILAAWLSGAGVLGGGGMFALNKLSNRSSSSQIKKQIDQHIQTLIDLLSEVERKHKEIAPLAARARDDYSALPDNQKQGLAQDWERAIQLLLAKSRSFEKEKDQLQILMASEEIRKALNVKKSSAITRMLLTSDLSLVSRFSSLSLFGKDIGIDWRELKESLEMAKLER